MDWEVTIKGENEETYVDKEILKERYLILNTNGFCIINLDQIMYECGMNNEENGIIDKERMIQDLDEFISHVYDYAYDLIEDFANNNEYEIE